MIIEYKLHRNEKGECVTPGFVENGGYFAMTNFTYIGYVPDVRPWTIPEGVVRFTSYEDFETRMLAYHSETPFSSEPDTGEAPIPFTEDEAKAEILKIWNKYGSF
jgi:hypothetical protein